MTGWVPIKKYSSGSELNMFKEYCFPTDSIYDTLFGFTTEEVKELRERNRKNGRRLREMKNGVIQHTGKILAVGSAYDSKFGKHHCEVRDITSE